MSLADRLRALERTLGSRPCPECGAGGSDDGEPVFRWLPAAEADKPCGTCGRVPRVIRMRPIRLDEQPAGPAKER